MAKRKAPSLAEWFRNCGPWGKRHDPDVLRRGLAAGLLNEQDEYGMTALASAVMSGWVEGVQMLLDAGADTELWYFRTGETALRMAVDQQNEVITAALVAAGADPDAPNHWGLTPRGWATRGGTPDPFAHLPRRSRPLPPPLIQNAEHLVDHYHPRFKIPDREERETLPVGRAVNLYVYGPRTDGKQDTVKVRITKRAGRRPRVRYTATVETPIEQTHLTPGTEDVTFGPEHVATVWLPKAGKG